MMEVEFLRKRAEDFLRTSKYHFKEKMYHLVAFDLDQALQLYLKYFLYFKDKTLSAYPFFKRTFKTRG